MVREVLHVQKLIIGAAVLAGLGATHASGQPIDNQGVDAVSRTLIPLATQFTLGVAIGFCVGFLAKKVVKIVAVLVGLVFVLLQVLAYADIVTVHWSPIAAWWDMMRRPENLEGQWNAVYSILFANVPALVGAVPGLILGLKKG